MTRHLTTEEIAGLAEGMLGRERAAVFHAHLAGCAGCTAAVAEAVRHRAARLARRERFELSQRSPDREPVRTHTWRQRGLPAAGVAMAMVAAGAWALVSWRSAPTLGFSVPAAVRASIESSSTRELVLPGGERHAGRVAPEMRSGDRSGSPELMLEVGALTTSYEGGERSADDAARLVTGLIATGDMEAANAYAREGLRGYPRDVRLLVLMADLKYRASDLAAAERYLRSASGIAPRDPLVSLD